MNSIKIQNGLLVSFYKATLEEIKMASDQVISQKDFKQMTADLIILRSSKKRKFSRNIEKPFKTLIGVTYGGMKGSFLFSQQKDTSPKFLFHFISDVGDYERHCVEKKIDSGVTVVSSSQQIVRIFFDFDTYEDFVQSFIENSILLYHNFCTYHTQHSNSEICPSKFLSGEEEKCGICFEDKHIEKLQKTRCNHFFCLPCLNQWAKIEFEKSVAKADDDDDDDDVDEDGLKFFLCPKCRHDLHVVKV